MIFEPPAAEEELDHDESCTHQEACRMTAMSEKTEAPVVENQTSDYRLRQVIGETHLSVWSDLYEPVFSACLIVGESHSRHDHEHHAEVLPHVEHHLETVGYAWYALSRFWCQIEDRKEQNEARKRDNKNVLPYDKIVSFIVEQSFTSEEDSEEEKAHSLRHSAVFNGPKEVYRQSVTDSGGCYIED